MPSWIIRRSAVAAAGASASCCEVGKDRKKTVVWREAKRLGPSCRQSTRCFSVIVLMLPFSTSEW